ncbi:hypothetical protein TRAPUB_6011 [Trametes pubescens]|uniref:Uncharacterized protein n=1 Tax=Trametes pubescens TaxID=154538 RepID=A0A1M2V729_TRAPU|nr:hypothetical protein TRAPUB_6011 [Trametes pubescens]
MAEMLVPSTADANMPTRIPQKSSPISIPVGVDTAKQTTTPSPLRRGPGEGTLTSTSPLAALHVERHEHGIRCRNEKTVWFSSSGSDLLPTPPALSLACLGDLYVHNCNDGSKQAWISMGPAQWLSVDLGHDHPYLKGYILNFCGNGEPSWVKKDTVRTYNGRKKQRERKQRESNAPEDASTSTTAL